jgi:hypothetical protein
MRTSLLCHFLPRRPGGCAIVVAPGADGDYQVRTPFNGNTVEGDGVPRASSARSAP